MPTATKAAVDLKGKGRSRAKFIIMRGHFGQGYILAGGLKMPPLRTYPYQMTGKFSANMRLRSVAVAGGFSRNNGNALP